jgi:PAS domain S-box-containing protein
LYTLTGTRLGGFGDTPRITSRDHGKGTKSDDGRSFDVFWSAALLGTSHGLAARLDASWISAELTAFLWRIAGLVLLISFVVCAATMAIVGRTVLSPLLRMRANLTTAALDPANVDRYPMPPVSEDELGDVVAAINALLEQVGTSNRDSQQVLTRMVDQAADAIIAHDVSGKVVFANKACLKICRFSTAEEMGAAGYPRLMFPDGSKVFTVPGMEDANSFSREAVLTDRQGKQIPVLLNAARVPHSSRSPIRYYASITDISAIRAAHEEVERQNIELHAASRAKTEFLANMSHELRTPLNAVIGFSEVIKNRIYGPLGNERYADYANDIHASGEHLLQIINDILDLSKIEAGHMELHEESVNLLQVINDAAQIVHERAKAAELKFTTQAAPNLPRLWADERAIKQILINLLSNAIKFTPAGGDVTVSAEFDQGTLALSVRDTGLGMEPADVPKALAPFAQLDGSLARRHNGTGLGLPLVKSLATLHGGELVIDTAPDQGTTVRISFPRERTILAEDTRTIA